MSSASERWAVVERLYHDALSRPVKERAGFLAAACVGDDALREEVESLLAQAASNDFLAQPAIAMAVQMTNGSNASALIGRRIGIYQLVAPLGSGGMGEVYRARDTRLGREVAIKILPRVFTADADRLARFEREARLLAALNHPHIGAIYGFEESDDVRALVLELVEGETLAQRISSNGGPIGRGLPVKEALAIARQIADALDAAHEKGIVHRDLKPANIKITPDGVVKVLDFGLAKAGGEVASVEITHAPTMTIAGTRDGIILGTAAYMSPEQARGQVVDKRTDVWAFGCVLYEMLSGHGAFDRRTVSDTIAAILEHEPEWTALPVSAPQSIPKLLRHCLEKDPKRRLRDIGDVRVELDDVPISTSLGVVPPRHDRSPRGRSLMWSATAIVLAAAAAFALGRTAGSGAASSGPPTFSRVLRLTSSPAREMAPVISPDGKWVAYLSDARGPTDVWVQFIGGGQPINLTASAGLTLSSRSIVGGLEISPDSSRILFQAGPTEATSNSTYSVPAPLGGVPSRFLDNGNAGVRWSPDGRRIAFALAGGGAGDAIWIADADGSDARVLVRAEGNVHKHWPSWSADGRYVYFSQSITAWNEEPTEIYRVSADGGAPARFVATASRASFAIETPDARGLIYSANPNKADLSLWWRLLPAGPPVRLTTGVGEFAQARISLDGRTMVCTLFETRDSLERVDLSSARSSTTTSLGDGYGGDLDPDLSRNGEQMVFSSTRTGQRNLWIARGDGTEARPLTSGGSIDEYPQFAPDGQQVAFISNRGGDRGLWIVSTDGGVPRRVLATAVLPYFSWSPDGREIVYSTPAGELPGLSVLTVADGRSRRLPTAGGATAPVWSPVGDVIAYLEVSPNQPGQQAGAFVRFMTSAGRSIAHDIHQMLPFANGLLAWSPDGRAIAVARVPGTAAASVWIADLDPDRPVRQVLSLPADALIRGMVWSADGRSVIVGQERTSSDIVLFDQTQGGS